MDTIIRRDSFGPRNKQQTVRAQIGRAIYQARILDGAVTSLHRITQEYGGRTLGATHDKFTSVSKNHKDFARVASSIIALIDAADIAAEQESNYQADIGQSIERIQR